MIEVLFIVYMTMCSDPIWNGREIYKSESDARLVIDYGAKTHGCHYQLYKTTVTREDFVKGGK